MPNTSTNCLSFKKKKKIHCHKANDQTHNENNVSRNTGSLSSLQKANQQRFLLSIQLGSSENIVHTSLYLLGACARGPKHPVTTELELKRQLWDAWLEFWNQSFAWKESSLQPPTLDTCPDSQRCFLQNNLEWSTPSVLAETHISESQTNLSTKALIEQQEVDVNCW